MNAKEKKHAERVYLIELYLTWSRINYGATAPEGCPQVVYSGGWFEIIVPHVMHRFRIRRAEMSSYTGRLIDRFKLKTPAVQAEALRLERERIQARGEELISNYSADRDAPLWNALNRIAAEIEDLLNPLAPADPAPPVDIPTDAMGRPCPEYYASVLASRLFYHLENRAHPIDVPHEVLSSALLAALKPCQCDPPGSGEEYCSWECYNPS